MNTTSAAKWAWTVPATRIGSALTAFLVLVQGSLAGVLLGGSPSAVDVHRVIGERVLAPLTLAVFVVAVLAWRPRGGSWVPGVLAFLGMNATAVMIVMGFDNAMEGHIPLGIMLFGFYLLLAVWNPQPRPATT